MAMNIPGVYDLKTDADFRNLIQPISRQEYLQLETDLIINGCQHPIITWDGYIVAGHNRYEICRRNGIPFCTVELHFSCKEEVMAWICRDQLERSDLPEVMQRFLIGVLYESEKAADKERTRFGSYQNIYGSGQEALSKTSTAIMIAKKYHLARVSVEKYGAFARALNEVGKKEPAIISSILSGKYQISHNGVLELAKLPAEEVRRMNRNLERSNPDFVRYRKPRKDSQKNRNTNPSDEPAASVKDMPTYDPDSEITGLTLTIPSWISSISRVEKAADFSNISSGAGEKLQKSLTDLQNSTLHMLSLLREYSND